MGDLEDGSAGELCGDGCGGAEVVDVGAAWVCGCGGGGGGGKGDVEAVAAAADLGLLFSL